MSTSGPAAAAEHAPRAEGQSRRQAGAERRPSFKVNPLQWAIGSFCALVGALMLIVPHQFASPSFGIIRPFLSWVGGLYLLAGVALIAVAALSPRRSLTVAAHLTAGGVLLFYAFMLARTQTWGGAPAYLVLGAGTIVAGFMVHPRRRRGGQDGRDFFALLIGLCAVGNAVVMLALADQFRSPIYDLVRPYLRWFGLAFLSSGLLLVLAQLRTSWPQTLRWLAHVFVAVTFFSYMLLVSWPSRGITGIVFYGGFGALLVLLPWLDRALSRVDADTLRLRLALTFAAAAAVPLTLVVALITGQQERVALREALVNQQLLAATQAQNVAGYIRLHREAVALLASRPRLLSLPLDEQRDVLRQFNATYPDFFACKTFDASGRGLARSDEAPPEIVADQAFFEDAQRSGQPSLSVRTSQAVGRPVFTMGSPILGPSNDFVGLAACGLEAARLAMTISLPGEPGGLVAYLVDDRGRAIAHPDPALVESFTDLSRTPAVAALRVGDPMSGALGYGEGQGARLAGYATVPGLGWGIVVERPSASALASVHQAREMAFGLLLLVVVLAMLVGGLLARYLTAPLQELAHAVSQFARGNAAAPLPSDRVTEVRNLADAFGRMREDLTAAADARERAIELRDSFLSVAAHELKTPLTSLLGQAQLFQRRAASAGALDERNVRSLAVVVAQAQRLNRLVTDLFDISRLQQGRLELERAPVDLARLVDQIVEEVQPTLDGHSVERVGTGSPLIVVGDAMRLEQVLQNLISNAVKYSPGGGSVRVEVSRCDGEAQVAVADHGIGIPADALDELFEQFYRAPNARSLHIGGIGVGLYVVREIVTLHGGRVLVESVEGEGSTFIIRLPLAED